MEFDEYDYLEKSVEESAEIRKEKERRSSRHGGDHEKDGGSGERASRRSRAEEQQNGEKVDREDRDRSPRREKFRHQSSREAGRERDKDRDHPSRERDRRERDKGKEKERDRDKKREREKERDREKDRERREREREQEREREREREGERETERRSSSRSRRHDREVEREMERARSRERALRERELEKEMMEKESRRFKEKKEAVEPEVDPERDQRTVFAYQMPLKATERDAYEFFSKAGKVRDVRLIMDRNSDRNSRRSKGVGYIEFYDAMSVPMAIALSGQLLLGQPVMVKPSEAEKNLVQSNSTGTGVTGAAAARKIYVGNLPLNITEDQLRQVFEPFGPVELVQLPVDLETGHCRGYGFIQFAQVEHAKAAQSLNGKVEIAGRVIKVSSVTDHVGGQDAGANAADFEDDDGGCLSLNAQSRALLMQRLDRTGTASSIAGSLGVPVLNGAAPNQQASSLPMNGQVRVSAVLPTLASPLTEAIGEPSECVILKNMFDPGTEMDPDFDLDEVEEECSKFGPVKHIYVDKNSLGHVYLRFDSVAAAASCVRAMHMRWYARRSISAAFMRPEEYEAIFRSVSRTSEG
ncbi:RNA-binding protein 39-like [Phoenix dactylifera]|uniref:RNA-binding protein 39-like n=1 Tax=Phoenix dactylifera TaxID=42345 RepID=A0A8B7BS10_PHODC|nr:RNA-binding protein 39-like [Phoenix dactylifera]